MNYNDFLISATPDYGNRTFTIRKYLNGSLFVKYRTIKLSRIEFDQELANTQMDWSQFLKSGDYYKV